MTIVAFVVVALVFAGLAAVGYALFELTPFARHDDRYRDPRTGRHFVQAPHLENWNEFERRTHQSRD